MSSEQMHLFQSAMWRTFKVKVTLKPERLCFYPGIFSSGPPLESTVLSAAIKKCHEMNPDLFSYIDWDNTIIEEM